MLPKVDPPGPTVAGGASPALPPGAAPLFGLSRPKRRDIGIRALCDLGVNSGNANALTGKKARQPGSRRLLPPRFGRCVQQSPQFAGSTSSTRRMANHCLHETPRSRLFCTLTLKGALSTRGFPGCCQGIIDTDTFARKGARAEEN